MLLQMPDCSLPQSPDTAIADHLANAASFLASPPQYEAVSLCNVPHLPMTYHVSSQIPEYRRQHEACCTKSPTTQ